ncbi:MAG: xanthine dehydrogenase family protein molybdopterin-binding subunit, partial [Janthinobacterium lividum]
MNIIQEVGQSIMKKVVEHTPDRWLPGASPDGLRLQQGLIGAPKSRVDGALKVSGTAQFSAEVPMEDLLFAALLYSAIPSGRITQLDTAAAEQAPGVALVMTYKNAPRMNAPKVMMTAPKAAGASDLPVMQDDKVRWNGQAIAVVLATTQEQADYAKQQIVVAYEETPADTVFEKAMAHAREPDSLLGEPPTVKVGDAEAALEKADFVIDHLYTTPRHNHNAIELHATTVAWQGDKLIVHDATQMVNASAWTLAEIFGIKENQVRVMAPFVGGAFGGKGLWDHQILAVAASRLAGKPVRVVLSREGVHRSVGGRTTTHQRVALGANADGTLAALIHTGCAAMTPHNNCPEQFLSGPAPVRHANHEARPAGRRHEHCAQYLHACARRVGWHLRPGVGIGRAGPRHADRPDRTAPA